MQHETEFAEFVRGYLSDKVPDMKSAVANIKNDNNLIGSGVIDSFLFIDLCLAIEEKTTVPIDVAEIDFDEFSIAGLWGYIEKQRARRLTEQES